jgi:hypothetical protein
MSLMEALYLEAYGTQFKDEPIEIQRIWIESWNMAMKAINRQAVLLSQPEIM